MALSTEEIRTLSALLDEALRLPLDERDAWLLKQGGLGQEVVQRLRAAIGLPNEGAMTSKLQPNSGLHWLEKLGDAAWIETLAGAIASPHGAAEAFAEHDTIDRYRLKQKIGEGGMGEVWRATRTDQTGLPDVALKIPLQLGLHRQTAIRFQRERDVLARLSHPNIARIYDAGVSAKGVPFIAMEFVDGLPLLDYANSQKLPTHERLKLAIEIAGAIAEAHNALILHRDIKPSNILLTKAGRTKLLDFGTAKLLDDELSNDDLTRLAGMPLSKQHASPEQLVGATPSVADDVYSFGVVLYELFAGVRPYRLDRYAGVEILRSLIVPLPSAQVSAQSATERGESSAKALQRRLQGDLDAVIYKAIAFDSAQRYASIHDLSADLLRIANREPVKARSLGKWYVAQRFVQRHWPASLAAAAVAASLIIGASAALWQAGIARNELLRAQAVEQFLLRVFDSNSFAQTDTLNAEGSTARELLDRGAVLIQEDLKLEGEPRRDVLAVLSQVNADVSAHRTALALAQKCLAANALTPANARQQATSIACHLIVANAASSLNEPGLGSASLTHLLAAERAQPEAFSTSQRFGLRALEALSTRDTDWQRTAQLAAQAMRQLPKNLGDRSVHLGVQRLIETFADHDDAVANTLSQLALTNEVEQFGATHPRTIQARLLAAARARAAGEVERAREQVLAVKRAFIGSDNVGVATQGGWWTPIKGNAMDSPALLVAAIEIGRFEMDHGVPALGLLDVSMATTIAARLGRGKDQTLRLQARTAYAELALKFGRFDLADVHTRNALNAAQGRNDLLASEAMALRADWLMLNGNVEEAHALFKKSDAVLAALRPQRTPSDETARRLREATLLIIQGTPAAALISLTALQQHLNQSTYFLRTRDIARMHALNAYSHLALAKAEPTARGKSIEAGLHHAELALRPELSKKAPDSSVRRLQLVAAAVKAQLHKLRNDQPNTCGAVSQFFTLSGRGKDPAIAPVGYLLGDVKASACGAEIVQDITMWVGFETMAEDAPIKKGSIAYVLL
jgi:predicted Ser/Thr protein kinase